MRRRDRGQTLIIALMILGVMIGLGFVFAGLIARNISQTGTSRGRSVASDLAESGVRFAHSQLQFSVLGADWRPVVTPVTVDAGGLTRDPDALYLRAGTGFAIGAGPNQIIDRGGHDGLGPFSRIEFEKGRALIRVRYAPNDFSTFRTSVGNLKQPGKARNYLVIESIGRAGSVKATDPTTFLNTSVRISTYNPGDEPIFLAELAKMRKLDTAILESRKVIAFASVGLIEHARFITNKFRVSRPAEIGSLVGTGTGGDTDSLGITYKGNNVEIENVFGGDVLNAAGNVVMQGTGSLHSNASLKIHGRQRAFLNVDLGDAWTVAEEVSPANSASQITFVRNDRNGTNTIVLADQQLNSDSASFVTAGGIFRDGNQDHDVAGYPRSVGRKEPPSMLTAEPSTGINRYLVMTRDSGAIVNGRNAGRYGYGSGVYIDSAEKGNASTETEREDFGASRSMVQDWLNPNNASSLGWQGPYYIPIASYVRLYPDGFEVIRDQRGNSRTRSWRRPDGSNTSLASVRYFLRSIDHDVNPATPNRTFILNTLAHFGGAMPTAPVPDATFLAQGRQFNGVVFAEGDVRVRGVIPTDMQLTLASMGSIYIEGSITRGTVDRNGVVLARPSLSNLMLMAKDYTVLNTSMFFGPEPGEILKVKSTVAVPNTPNPIELDATASATVNLTTEFLLNPLATGATASNPQTWRAFATTYTEAGTNAALPVHLMMSHSADAGGPSFVRLDVSPLSFQVGASTSALLFPSDALQNAGVRSQYAPNDGSLLNLPIYGLTNAPTQGFPAFEINSTPFVSNAFGTVGRQLVAPAGGPFGDYRLGLQDSTALRVSTTSVGPFSPQNYLLAGVAAAPHDIRIEASIFAEDGSFFVIPGVEFNRNEDDTRQAFLADVAAVGAAQARVLRYQNTGNRPEVPFYGEPLNMRVSILGAVSENMPQPISVQAAWQRKWGWMPDELGASGRRLPSQHVPIGTNLAATPYVPNVVISYDPTLALASVDGVNPVRVSDDGVWVLPPMPRLPVSPSLSYFGEVNP